MTGTVRMSARELEATLLTRCVRVAREAASCAQDQREAHVFGLAATTVRSHFPRESTNLMRASEAYFAQHPDERLTPQEVLRLGWVSTLPRLRDMLSRRLSVPVDVVEPP